MKKPYYPRTAAILAPLTVAVSTGLLLRAQPAVAQQEPPAPSAPATTDNSGQARLERGLRALDALKQQADPEILAAMPTLRIVVERVSLHPEESSAVDLEIMRVIRTAGMKLKSETANDRGGGKDLASDLASLKLTLGAAKTKKADIASGDHKVPGAVIEKGSGGGKSARAGSRGRVGYVSIRVGSTEKVVAELPTSAGGYSPAERAKKIAQRIEAASKKDPLWYLSARPEARAGGQYVVAVDNAPDGYILTADKDFAKFRQTTPEKLAARLANDVRMTVDRPSTLAMGRSKSPAEIDEDKAARAVELRVQGDATYDRDDLAGAVKLYAAALENNPHYVILYERLINLYGEMGQTVKRHEMAKAAIKLEGLTAEQSAFFQTATTE